MIVIDLSRVIEETMPVYPGAEPPRIADVSTIARAGYAEKSLSLYSHTGTHLDAPGHVLEGAPRLDEVRAGQFIGPGRVLDVSAFRGRTVEVADLEKRGTDLREGDYVLLHSGWARFWGDNRYYVGYPVLSEPAARWLTRFRLRGIGVDMISVDSLGSTAMANHRIFLENKMTIVENLTGLEALIGKSFLFSCLPLKLAAADGSPVRAVAILL